jgi:hypothetical protein
MMPTRLTLAALALSLAACTHARGNPTPGPEAATPAAAPATPQTQPPPSGSPSDLKTIEAFNQRIKDYAALHNKLEATLPAMPTETSPQIIDKHQRALGQLMMSNRAAAKRGDIFFADADRLFRRLLGQVFSGAEGQKLKSTIMDENPSEVKLAVNARYPDQVPLSTMPPQVLALLPKLPPELEYRFIGRRLILLDIHAHTIVDYIDNVLPQ